MLTFSLAIISLGVCGALAVFARGNSNEERVLRTSGVTLTAIIGVSLLVTSFVACVPEGHEAVVLTFGGASDKPLAAGLNFLLPWQTTVEMPIRHHEWTQLFQCQSKDLQKMKIEMTVIYHRIPGLTAEIYKNVKMRSEETHLKPAGREVLKAAVAEFDASDVIRRREDLSEKVQIRMNSRIKPFNLELIECSIAQVDFQESYDARVEAKVIALESARKAEHELTEQKTRARIRAVEQSGVAEAMKEMARGAAESQRNMAAATAYATEVVAIAKAQRTRTVGEAEARRYERIGTALSDNSKVLQLESVRAWSGKVPQFISSSGDNGMPYVELFKSVKLKASTKQLDLPAISAPPKAPIEVQSDTGLLEQTTNQALQNAQQELEKSGEKEGASQK